MMGRLLPPLLVACVSLSACDRNASIQTAAESDVAVVSAWLNDQDPTPTFHRNHPGKPVAPVGQLIDGLRARLEQQPNDERGWRLLAQSYAHMGDMPNARLAAERAVDIGADSDELSATLQKAFRDSGR